MTQTETNVVMAVGKFEQFASFAATCLSLDLEVGKQDELIHQLAVVEGREGRGQTFQDHQLAAAFPGLDRLAEEYAILLGHNLIDFDLAHLAAACPGSRLLQLASLDTLRLNPLAFPQNPYHHLVKHYQDGQLQRGRLNDPELDARLTLELLQEQFTALVRRHEHNPELVLAWHWLLTQDPSGRGFDHFFDAVRGQPRPTGQEAGQAVISLLKDKVCHVQGVEALREAATQGWPLAYALAWLEVAGNNSVMPPWVRYRFPEAAELVRRWRDRACIDANCSWCSVHHSPVKALHRWFGYEGFRPEPRGADGRPLQELIVQAAMQGRHVLGILPTGTGKSLCYQIPALSRFEKTGALHVVISPLVALMADQVAGLEARGIQSCAAINGMLSMPERADVLARVRLGDIGIVIISPEQLRNKTVRRVLEQREIGAWILDEAHCLSKWGHDFRPDYRYVGRFIKERSGDAIPPIVCLTATAKPDVVEDIVSYFREKLGITLEVFNGGAERTNLDFSVLPTSEATKLPDIHNLLTADLPADRPGGAIVYCSTRKRTEEVAAFLQQMGLEAAHFHAGLPAEVKKSVQERFIQGDLRVIAATNAFGMGIDKPDVRLVIHADIPGSLENYLQEAGRAGRDRAFARCVLLYTADDVERQFGMTARTRLTQREIQAILNRLKKLDRKKRTDGRVVATSGEILAMDDEEDFTRDSVATDDTRVRTAVAWLEEATLLRREENHTQLFPSSLRVASFEEARAKLEKLDLQDRYRRRLLAIAEALLRADPDAGVSTDELMLASGLDADKLRAALYDLERVGIASNDTALTAFVHSAVERSSLKRFEAADGLEQAFLDELREAAPELGKGDQSLLRLRALAQALRDKEHADVRPDLLWRVARSIAGDGRQEDSGVGSWRLKRLDGESATVELQREWTSIVVTAARRRKAARRLLEHLLGCLPPGARGADLLAETTVGNLLEALKADPELMSEVKSPEKLLDRALMWLHEQEIIRLNKGLAVFRQAMTIHLSAERRTFVKTDYEPLQDHYDEQVTQIHVMAEYVERGLRQMADALRLTVDYFSLRKDEFLARWLPDRKRDDLTRQTTPESWRRIVDALNQTQQRIVTDDREQTNVLVLAGPGSGKTRALVHRIAYLIRVKRENPRGVLALTYNRHAAVEIRTRLAALIGDDARGVTVMTCHALAMRLAGVSFRDRQQKARQEDFDDVLQTAVDLLRGEGLPPDEADDQREHLLSGFRWILVDEYQDITPAQYELISALAGRTLQDADARLTLFAVGDDDQNIYAFQGASVDFIRRFEADYAARPTFLIENYRSTAHIIEAANRVIGRAGARMKAEHPIAIDRNRKKDPLGGAWEARDPVGRGRVQVLPAGETSASQAVAAVCELQRLAALDPNWDWRRCAVIARKWQYLYPVRALCEELDIPVQLSDEKPPPLWLMRETRLLKAWLLEDEVAPMTLERVHGWLAARGDGPWWRVLREAIEAYLLELGREDLPSSHFADWLDEWTREHRRKPTGLALLTAHGAKGLEFDHVVVLDGGWDGPGRGEDADAPRRLYYVAMTRARHTLALARSSRGLALIDGLTDVDCFQSRQAEALDVPEADLDRIYRQVSLAEVHLGFAGRFGDTDPVHAEIAALATGNPLQLRQQDGSWCLFAGSGRMVGRMSRAFEPPAGYSCIAAHVSAVVSWGRAHGDVAYQDQARCERWEVVIPELVFARR